MSRATKYHKEETGARYAAASSSHHAAAAEPPTAAAAGAGHIGPSSFPDEDQDFYCLQCLMPCSALSLLVGEHTNHPRRRIEEAYETAPTDITREVAEYAHCVQRFANSIEQRTAEYHAREAAIVERLHDVVEAIKQLQRDQASLEEEWATNGFLHDEDVQLQGSQLKDLRETGRGLRRASDVWLELYEASMLRHRAGASSIAAAAQQQRVLTPTLCQAACTDLEAARGQLTRTLKDLEGTLEQFTTSVRSKATTDGQRGGFPNAAHEHHHEHHHQSSHSGAAHVTSSRAGIDRDALYWFQLQQQQRRLDEEQRRHEEEEASRHNNHHGGIDGDHSNSDSCSPVTDDALPQAHLKKTNADRQHVGHHPRHTNHASSDLDDSDDVQRQHRVRMPTARTFSPSLASRVLGTAAAQRRHGSDLKSHRLARTTDNIDAIADSLPPVLRQYYHLRSCLRDALSTNQPAALVNTFVRCIRQLREEAELAGIGDELERIARKDPEYKLLV